MKSLCISALVLLALHLALRQVELQRPADRRPGAAAPAAVTKLNPKAPTERPAATSPASPSAVSRSSSPYLGLARAYLDRMTQSQGFVSSDPVLLKDPAYRRHFEITVANMVERKYVPLLGKLGCSEDVAAKLRGALAQKILSAIDFSELSVPKDGTPLTANALAQLKEEITTQNEANISELLSPQQYKMYQDFERNYPIRQFLSAFEGRSSFSAEPITPAQFELVVSTVAAARGDVPLRGPNARPLVVDERALADLAPVLSARQVELLRSWWGERFRADVAMTAPVGKR